MGSLLRDLTFAIRMLLKERAFALTAILTLAISIGGNVAAFTIVRSVVLRPLPVPEADRIVLMSNQYPNAGVGDSNFSGVVDYYDRLGAVPALETQAVFRWAGATVEVGQAPERLRAMTATPSLFELLRIQPSVGRAFGPDDAVPGSETKTILSHGLWQQLFAGDPDAVGSDLRIGGRPHTVVGVMPPGFVFMDPDVRLWLPAAFSEEDRSDDNRHSNGWHNVGRLAEGATVEQVRAQVDALNAANDERFPQFRELLANAGFRTRVEPLQNMLTRDIAPTLFMLWAGAGLVLLIGAVNLANLALARTGLRVRELATRMALGAPRRRVIRQLATESVLLSVAGGAAGLAIGAGILRLLGRVGIDQLPRAGEIRLDAVVIAFTVAVSIAAGLLIALMPAGRVLRFHLGRALTEEGRSGTGGRGRSAARRVLVVAQVGLAFVLLVGAGLLLASFRELLRVDPGFDPRNVLTASVSLPSPGYPERADLEAFTRRALDAIRVLPGVVGAAAGTAVPFDGNSSDSVILAEGYQMQPGESLISPRQLRVSPGYFETLGISLRQGRDFEERDTSDAPGVVIVDQRLARKFWPGADPIGRRMYQPTDPNDLFAISEDTRWLTVVGVVEEVRAEDLDGRGNQAGAYYFPISENPPRSPTFAIRTAGAPEALLPTLRAGIQRIDPTLPMFDVRTMEERRDLSLVSRRAATLLALSFAGVALLISAVGVYGVLAYLVSQRTREIGIRMALGSTARDVFRLVLGEGLALAAVGLAFGIAATALLGRFLERQVYGVEPLDPGVIGAGVLVLALVALAASALPARRATRVDPVIVLNE